MKQVCSLFLLLLLCGCFPRYYRSYRTDDGLLRPTYPNYLFDDSIDVVTLSNAYFNTGEKVKIYYQVDYFEDYETFVIDSCYLYTIFWPNGRLFKSQVDSINKLNKDFLLTNKKGYQGYYYLEDNSLNLELVVGNSSTIVYSYFNLLINQSDSTLTYLYEGERNPNKKKIKWFNNGWKSSHEKMKQVDIFDSLNFWVPDW